MGIIENSMLLMIKYRRQGQRARFNSGLRSRVLWMNMLICWLHWQGSRPTATSGEELVAYESGSKRRLSKCKFIYLEVHLDCANSCVFSVNVSSKDCCAIFIHIEIDDHWIYYTQNHIQTKRHERTSTSLLQLIFYKSIQVLVFVDYARHDS